MCVQERQRLREAIRLTPMVDLCFQRNNQMANTEVLLEVRLRLRIDRWMYERFELGRRFPEKRHPVLTWYVM